MAVNVLIKPSQRKGSPITENGIPPLQAGDVLTRPEFERRYHEHPEIKKAELIEGVVFMPSPVKAKLHGDPHFVINTWLGVYCASTPGITGSDNASLRLDLVNAPQPDVLLRLDPELGGNTIMDADGYLEGSPELTVEIAASSSSYDMNQKKSVYARHGIQEYLVLLTYEQKVVWFSLADGGYKKLDADKQGILRSEVFPGLWLQSSAIWTNDLATMLSVLQKGLASSEHTLFLEKLTH